MVAFSNERYLFQDGTQAPGVNKSLIKLKSDGDWAALEFGQNYISDSKTDFALASLPSFGEIAVPLFMEDTPAQGGCRKGLFGER